MAGGLGFLFSQLDYRRHPLRLTIGSIVGLGAGLLLGIAVHKTQNPHLQLVVSVLKPVGTIWVKALQLIILPLVGSHLVVSIASKEDSEKPGRMGGLTSVCFVSLLSLGAVFSLAVAPALAHRFNIDPITLTSLQASLAVHERVGASAAIPLRQWILGLVPLHPLKAAAEGDILPLLIAILLLAIAIRNTRTEYRLLLVGFFRAVAEMTLVLVRGLFCVLPIVVFVLISGVSSRTGPVIASGIGYFMVVLCGLLLAFTVFQYLIASLVGGVSIRRFAWGVLPAQAIAVATRSSLASLPALLDGAQHRIGLPSSVGAFVLPLSVSTFKVNRTISAPLKLIFLAHLFGVPLEPISVVVFVIGVMILSFGTPGVPSGGALITLPLYRAAGIPIEGIVLLTALDAIPDIFRTLLNVTADMTVATVVARFAGARVKVGKIDVNHDLLLARTVK